MFEHTDENGTLYIPEWPYDGNCDNTEHFYQCAMNWSENAAENVVSEYRFLYAALEEIAKKWDSINSDSDIEKLSPNLRDVWNTFLRDFETGGIDVELAMDISDRMETIDMVKSVAEKIKNGTDISKEEFSFYNNCRGTNITEKEKAIYNAYRDAIHADANHRIGNGIAAYDVVIRAKRLCRLMSLKAPEIIINNEANLLAQAIAIHADAFKAECRRILRPNGKIIIVYNSRNESADCTKALAALRRKYNSDFHGFSNGMSEGRCIDFFGSDCNIYRADNTQCYTRREYIDRVLSSSYSLKKDDDGFSMYMNEINNIFDAYSKDGIISVPTDTVAYIGSV